jgi:acyl-coenzyme A thioesterase PaaI-like protein
VVHGTGVAVDVGTVVVTTSAVITRRRSGAVFDVGLFAEHAGGPLLGFATVTYTPLPHDGPRYVTEVLRQPWPPLDLATTMDQLVGGQQMADGSLVLALTDDLRNGVGALAGGFSTLLVDVVAERAAEHALGGPVALTDLAVHFLAAGRVGPLRVRPDVVATRGGSASVRVRIIDEGAGDRPILSTTSTAVRTEEPRRP